jgi:glycosyltransferase involved in cell wall biosynthesis
MNVPKVTVGIPVFNGDQFLRKSIESIINQSYQDIEIIISDNCSTDNTQTICLEYASRDNRIRYIRQSKNYGSINNFVVLLSEARGKYFMWAGADDVIDDNWIASLLEICERDNSLAFGVVQYIDEFDVKIDSVANIREFNYKGPAWWRLLYFVFTPWLFGKMILCWGLYPRELLLKITKMSFISKWGAAVDSIWVYSILSVCKINSTPSTTLHKRVHQNSESSILGRKKVESNLGDRIFRLLEAVLKVNMFFTFLALSPLLIKVLLLFISPLLYPVYVIRSVWVLMLYKIRKMRLH